MRIPFGRCTSSIIRATLVEVVGAVEFLSVVAVGQDNDLSVLFGARDPAPAVGGVPFACEKPSAGVKLETVRAAARLAEYAHLAAFGVVNHDAVVRDIGEENVASPIHHRTFGEPEARSHLLKNGILRNDSGDRLRGRPGVSPVCPSLGGSGVGVKSHDMDAETQKNTKDLVHSTNPVNLDTILCSGTLSSKRIPREAE